MTSHQVRAAWQLSERTEAYRAVGVLGGDRERTTEGREKEKRERKVEEREDREKERGRDRDGETGRANKV